MLEPCKTKTNIFVGLGIVVQGLAGILKRQDGLAAYDAVLDVGTLAGWILIVVGAGFYAKAKGYHWAWGLLGVFSILGLLVLVFFPDRHKAGAAAQQLAPPGA